MDLLNEILNEKILFNKEDYQGDLNLYEKIFTRFNDYDIIKKKNILTKKLSEISTGLTNEEQVFHKEISSKISHNELKKNEDKQEKLLKKESGKSLEGLKNYQDFIEKRLAKELQKISENDKKKFEKINKKLEKSIGKNEEFPDFKGLSSFIEIFSFDYSFNFEAKNKKEKKLFEEILTFFNLDELKQLMKDLEFFNILKTEDGLYKFDKKINDLGYTQTYNLIYLYVIPFLYLKSLEKYDVEKFKFDIEKLKEITFSFGRLSSEQIEINEKIIGEFTRNLYDLLNDESNFELIKHFRNFAKLFLFENFYEEENKKLNKEIRKINDKNSRTAFINNKFSHSLFNSQYFFEIESLRENEKYIEGNRPLCIEFTFVPIIRMLSDIGILELDGFFYKSKFDNLTKKFWSEILFFLIEIIYEKFEKELPGPLLEDGIGLLGFLRKGKKKDFVLIENFGINFENLDKYKEIINERSFTIIEKKSNKNDNVYLFIQDNVEIKSIQVKLNQIIRNYEETLEKPKKKISGGNQEMSDVVKQAIKEMKEKEEKKKLVEKEKEKEVEKLGNIEFNENFDGSIFYELKEKEKFWKIDKGEFEYSQEKKQYFHYFEFTKESHKIQGIPGNLLLFTNDKEVNNVQILNKFKKFIEKDDRKVLNSESYFFHSNTIFSGKEKELADGIFKFFDNKNNFIILKQLERIDESGKEQEMTILDVNINELMKGLEIKDLDEEKLYKTLLSDEIMEYGMYALLEKDIGNGMKIDLLTSNKLDENQFITILKVMNKKHNLGIDASVFSDIKMKI